MANILACRMDGQGYLEHKHIITFLGSSDQLEAVKFDFRAA